MAKDYTKSSSGVVKGVKQMRGPGMNLGLKKPRKKMAQPKDYGSPKSAKAGKKAATGSYLPDFLGLGRKKSKP